jgi:predicted extracellular nuclease
MPSASGQQSSFSFEPEKDRKLRVMFYNAENAFDTINNPGTDDQEFLPSGPRHWNKYKYYDKINKIYKVIAAAGGWTPPEIIGLCEIENKSILKDIVRETPFSKYQYQIIHKNSPDHRGIDVAAIYNASKFKLISYRYIPVRLPEPYRSTREILYIKGWPVSSDTMHIYFNHWPSKWQGAMRSQPKRIKAAQVLRCQIDSLFKLDSNASILLAGDFNDSPEAESLTKYLRAKRLEKAAEPGKLYNLSFEWKDLHYGTYKYQGIWQILDQLIVSGSLLDTPNGLMTTPEDAQIMVTPYLLTEDKKYTGNKPFRSYLGYRYKGGFSDHLPVILDFH